MELIVGFGLAGGHFRNRFVFGQTKGDGQAGFFDDARAQLRGVGPDSKKAIHAGEVDVEFVDGGFFIDRRHFFDDFGHHARKLGVGLGVAFDADGFWATLFGHFHGHARAHAKAPGFIAARGHYSPFAGATNQNRFLI